MWTTLNLRDSNTSTLEILLKMCVRYSVIHMLLNALKVATIKAKVISILSITGTRDVSVFKANATQDE